MGCKQVDSKRHDTVQAIKVSSNGMTTSGSVPSLNFLLRYKGQNQGMVTYPVNAKIHSLVRDIVSKLPYSSPENKYQFKINGNFVSADLKAEISSIAQIKEVLNSITHSATGNGKLHEVIVDVLCLGLDNIPTDVVKAYNNVRLLAKPLIEPFEVAIFDRESGLIKTEELTREVEQNSEISLFSDLSASCNGENHLYLSGGENKSEETINHFWVINLLKKKIQKHPSGLKNSRKFHSMIYVPNSYVFIVGGQNVNKVEYYDIRTKEISEHSTLNEERIEPGLAVINNSFLYTFTGFYSYKGKIFDTFERINLRGNDTWELIKPKLSRDLLRFNQKFFAVSHHKAGEVIFLGGSLSNEDQSNKNSFVYDYINNEIKASNVPFEHVEFSEKFFYPFKDMDSFLIPMLNDRDGLKIYGYSQDKLSHISFEPDTNLSVIQPERFSFEGQDVQEGK